MDSESSTKFIGSLTKFLQSLCNGYVEFDDGVELIGHIYLSVDAGKTGKTLNYFLNEKVCKNDNSVTFISNSFHAQPEAKSKASSGKDGETRKEDGDVSDSGDVPKSTNVGTILSRPQVSSRSGSSPNQNRTGTKRPGSPLKGPVPSQRRASTPPSQRRIQSSAARGTLGSPVSKTVPSSPSSSSQDNIPSPSPARKSRTEIGHPTSNQSENVNADTENDIVPPNVLSINPTAEFASFLGSLTSDNQTSQDQPSPPDTKPDTDVTFIKEEFVSEPSSCAQAGSSGQHSGRSGEDNSGLYPVMLHQNTSVFPSTSAGYHAYQGGASATATSQHPGFPGTSSSQSDPFNPVAGTSQDGADPSGEDSVEQVFMVSPGYPDVSPGYPDVCFVSSGGATFTHQQGPHLPQDISCVMAVSDESNSNNPSSSTVSYDTPLVFSTAEHPPVTISGGQSHVAGLSGTSASFSLSEPSASFSGVFSVEPSAMHGNAMSYVGPQPQLPDIKYDMTHLLMWSQDQGELGSLCPSRGPGRPRKSVSRVQPYDRRKSAHKKQQAGMKQTGPSVSPLRGLGRSPRGRGHASPGRGRGRQKKNRTSPQKGSAASPYTKVSASLLAGALRALGTNGGRGGRGVRSVQRGQGFHSLKELIARKYSHKAGHPEAQSPGGDGGQRGRRGGARRGAGRPRKTQLLAPAQHRTSKQTKPAMAPDSTAVSPSEGVHKVEEISPHSGLTETFAALGEDAVNTQAGHPKGRGAARRGVGRPRKVPGPGGRGSSGHRMPSTSLKKETPPKHPLIKTIKEEDESPLHSGFPMLYTAHGDNAVEAHAAQDQGRTITVRAYHPKGKGGARRGAGRPRKVWGPGGGRMAGTAPQRDAALLPEEPAFSPWSPQETSFSGTFPDQGDDTAPSLAELEGVKSEAQTKRPRGGARRGAGRPRKMPGPSSSQQSGSTQPVPSTASGEGTRGSVTHTGFRRSRGRISAALAKYRLGSTLKAEGGRGRIRVLASRGRTRMMSSRGRGGRLAHSVIARRGGVLTSTDRHQGFSSLAHIRGRSGRRGGFRVIRGRGVRGRGVNRPSPISDEEEEDREGDTDNEDVSVIKPFECSACGKRYVFNTGLSRHHKICENRSRYQCILCDQAFIGLVEFSHHVQAEHGIDEKDVMMLNKKV